MAASQRPLSSGDGSAVRSPRIFSTSGKSSRLVSAAVEEHDIVTPLERLFDGGRPSEELRPSENEDLHRLVRLRKDCLKTLGRGMGRR